MSDASQESAAAPGSAEPEFAAFISYATDPDQGIARRVESFLESFHTLTRGSGIDVKPIQVCRDASDFAVTGKEAQDAAQPDATIDRLLESNLARSRFLLILCSSKTPQSRWVALEAKWFLENRGAEHVLLAPTEGRDPVNSPEEIFPPAVLEAGLQRKPWYDLRGFRGRVAKSWMKVREPEEELARLAAHLSGDTAGRLYPVWQRETRRRRRRTRLLLGIGVIAIAAAASIAVWQGGRREEAVAAFDATSLVIAGESNLTRDTELAMLLGIAAADRTMATEGTILPAAAALLQRAVLATPALRMTNRAGVNALAWSADGGRIAAGDQDGGVAIFDATTGSTMSYAPGQDYVESVDWSPDGKWLASGAQDGTVVIRDTRTWQTVRVINFGEQVMSVHWRPGTHQFAAGLAIGPQSRVDVYDYDGGTTLFSVPGMRGTWSPTGDRIITGGFAGEVRIFTADGQLIAERPGHSRYVHSLRWRPDGRRFATASVDDTVQVWDAIRHERIATLPNPFALGLAWSPDGTLLASGAGTEFVTVWDGETFQPIFQLTGSTTLTGDPLAGAGPQGFVVELQWNSDGSRLAVADRGDSGGTGAVLVYPTGLVLARTAEDWLELARALASRGFTSEECFEYFGSPQCPPASR